MLKKIFFLVTIALLVSCEKPTQFSKKALNDVAYSLHDKPMTIKDIINQYKGKKIVIDVWASWCSDCIKGLPKVKILQKKFPDVVFLFLSVDTKKEAWKSGIQRFNISGSHYNLPKGMKHGDFVNFLELRWIPRYLVVDEQGNIKLFKATNANDVAITEALK